MKTFKEYVEEQRLLEEGRIMDILKKLGFPLMLAGGLMMTSTGCSPKPETIGQKAYRDAAAAINQSDSVCRQADLTMKALELKQKADRLHNSH